jgi:hypothetical protein
MRFDDSAQESAATPVRAHVLIVHERQVMVHPISWADVVVLSSFGIVKEDAESMAIPAM